MPESSTAISTSGRPVVTVHAVDFVASASTIDPPRIPLFSWASWLTGSFPASGDAAYFQSSPPRPLGTWPGAEWSWV